MANRLLKLNDALESYLNKLIRDCHLTYEDLKKPETISNLSMMLEMTMSAIFTTSEIAKSKIKYKDMIEASIKQRFFYTEPNYTSQDLDIIDIKFKVINSHQSHAQRSMEWYNFRWERLTASDLAKAIGEKGDKSKLDLIYQKSIPLEQYIKKREGFSLGGQPAIMHGVCFEAVATGLYELYNMLTVKEYGCLPHNTINYLAASPDGICDSRDDNPNYHGRMLEIKCPYSRIITGIPKLEYYMQVQLQLEVCDLEYCDFLECDIRTYPGMRSFLDDSPTLNGIEDVSYNLTKSGKKKGVLYEYIEKSEGTEKNTKYKYCPLTYTDEEVSQWIINTKDEIMNNSKYIPIGCKYWWIEEYNVTLIKREREYFNNMLVRLNEFWKSVLYYRNNPKNIEELEIKIGIRPKPPSQLEAILLKNDMSDEMYYHTIPTDVIEPDEIKNVQFLNDNDSSDSDSNTITTTTTKATIEIKKKVVKNLMFIKPDEDENDDDD
jgi:putative phage-type endonuclease